VGCAIDYNILRFDIPMGYGEHGEIVESSKDLIGVEFGEHGIDFFLFDDLIEVV
jgi:hypothetical protein